MAKTSKKAYVLEVRKGDLSKVTPSTFAAFQKAMSALVKEAGAESIVISHGGEHERNVRKLMVDAIEGP